MFGNCRPDRPEAKGMCRNCMALWDNIHSKSEEISRLKKIIESAQFILKQEKFSEVIVKSNGATEKT